MKIHLILFCLFGFATGLFAQANDIDIIQEKVGATTKIYAKSNTKTDLMVEFSATGSGFTANKSLPVKVKVPGLAKVEVVHITPKPNETMQLSLGYTYEVIGTANPKTGDSGNAPSYSQSQPSMPLEKLNKGIVLFSKDGCGRCTYASKYLKDNNIPFIELNISKNPGDQKLMWDKAKEAGFNGGSIQTPVVMYNGKVNLNSSDLKATLSAMK